MWVKFNCDIISYTTRKLCVHSFQHLENSLKLFNPLIAVIELCKKKLNFCWLLSLYLIQIAYFVRTQYSYLQVPIEWEDVDVTPVKGPDGNFRLPSKIFDSMGKTKLGLKGPLATPIGKGHKSLNLALRK